MSTTQPKPEPTQSANSTAVEPKLRTGKYSLTT